MCTHSPGHATTRNDQLARVAGMRGIDPNTDTLVSGDEARIRQALLNMRLIAESEGASLRDAVRGACSRPTGSAFAQSGTKCRKNYGAGHLTLPAPPSRCIGSIRMTSSRSRILSTRRSRGAAKSNARFVNPWSYLPGQERISASEHPAAGTRQSPDPPLRIYVLLFRLCIAHEWSSLFPVFLRQRPTSLFWLLRLPCPAPF
jgi:hypothetical protein